MIRQTVLPFTAHGGLALLAEYTHALGLRALVDGHLPPPGSSRASAPSVVVETIVLLRQAGGRTLADLPSAGAREKSLLTLLGHDAIPDPDTVAPAGQAHSLRLST